MFALARLAGCASSKLRLSSRHFDFNFRMFFLFYVVVVVVAAAAAAAALAGLASC